MRDVLLALYAIAVTPLLIIILVLVILWKEGGQ